MHRSSALFLLFLLTAFGILDCSVAAAQTPQPEPIVTEVAVEQEGQPVTDPLVTSLIETKAGQPLSMEAVRRTIARLISINRYDDAQAIAEPVANGIRLRWVLLPLHPIDRIEFTGMTGLTESELRRIVTDRFSGPPTEGHVDEAADLVRTQLRSRGFLKPSVETRVVPTHDPDRATLFFQINAGMRATITEVRFEQVDAEGRSNIVDVPDIKKGQPYDEEALDRELQAWERRMHNRGYYEARGSRGPIFLGNEVILSVNLARGPHVRVEFAGDPLPDSEKERLVPVKAEASADEDLLEDSTRAIENYLHQRGYRDAMAPHSRQESDGELIITFRVSRGPRYLLRDLRFTGNESIPTAQLEGLVKLKNGEPFVRSSLDAGIQAVVNTYRAQGFTRAQVKADDAIGIPEDPKDPDRGIEVTLAIAEGPRSIVRNVTFEGNKAIAESELQRKSVISPGRAFVAAELLADRDGLETEYRNRGYLTASVASKTSSEDNGTQVDVHFSINEGPQILVDHIIIIGNRRTKAKTIEDELVVREGGPLGEAAIAESRVRLNALQLFRNVQIEPASLGSEPRRDLIVRVEEAPPTFIGLGAGVEGGYQVRTGPTGLAEDQFEVAPRGFFQIGRRNLFGKNRTANLYTRVSLRSRNPSNVVPPATAPVAEPSYGFHEYRVVPSFTEPRVFGLRSNLQVSGILEQAIRTSFNFRRRELRAQDDFTLSRRYRLTGFYALQHTTLFDVSDPSEKPLIDRLFPTVRLSRFSGSLSRDTRDDALDPSLGTFGIVSGDIAARAIGSQVGYIKTYVQGFVFRRLPVPRRMVLALGARVGLAHGFPRTQDGLEVSDLPASERFYAGGDNSVRGFPLDRLVNEETVTPSGYPTGGNGVIVLNSEVRVNLFGQFQGAAFVDAGNVFPRANEFSVTDLRPAAGFGVMYRSPVGPIRVDLGFNLQPRTFSSGVTERGYVVHFLLGQPF
jgi:outer membrane protein assembly complex protein YaeT